ncbi:MAG: deoxyribose-phosphate aldolase [Aestuariibaculum sp.]
MKELHTFIDHTLLKATATQKDIIKLCDEAKEHHFFSVCINSCYVPLAKSELNNNKVKICSVVGFPLGAMSTAAKAEETKQAIIDGADEIDMVLNIGLFKSKNFDAVKHDITTVKACIPNNILKVILETGYLDNNDIIKASKLAIEAGADFIKTSTGFGSRGASFSDITLMKQTIKGKAKIKASGGIKDYKTALKYINLGAERLGTSSGVAIVTGQKSTENY